MRTPRGIVQASDFQTAPAVANQWLNSVSTGLSAYVAGPAVSAILGTRQTIPGNVVDTKIIFDVLEYDLDPQHSYNTVTGQFQPHIAGYYLINATVGLPTIYTISLYLNGQPYRRYTPHLASTTIPTLASTISQTVYLNGSTDFIEVWANQSSTSPVQTDATFTYSGRPIAGATTFFSANLLRPA